MTPKVLIYVDDGQIDVMHTRGVEVAVIVEGEDVQIPDDWIGLLGRQHHSLPITINREELPQKRPPECDSEQLAVPDMPEPHHSGLMKAPYCADCDGNHPRSIGCDGLPRDSADRCRHCGVWPGESHMVRCPAGRL